MKIGLQEVDWEYVGAVFATMQDEDQAKFFKSMLKEMSTWQTAHQGEMQLCAVNHLLTDEEKDKISMLGYKEES